MNRRGLRTGATLWVVVAVIAGVVLAAGLWFWAARGVPSIKNEAGRQIAESFLNQVRDGKPQLAWDETSAEFKSDIGREDFVRDVRKEPVLKESLAFQSLAPVPDHPLALMESVFLPPAKEGQHGKRVRVWLGVDQGTWKVERLFVD